MSKNSKTYLAEDKAEWRYVGIDEPAPSGQKIHMLNAGGISIDGNWDPKANHKAWSPLLKTDKYKEDIQAGLAAGTIVEHETAPAGPYRFWFYERTAVCVLTFATLGSSPYDRYSTRWSSSFWLPLSAGYLGIAVEMPKFLRDHYHELKALNTGNPKIHEFTAQVSKFFVGVDPKAGEPKLFDAQTRPVYPIYNYATINFGE